MESHEQQPSHVVTVPEFSHLLHSKPRNWHLRSPGQPRLIHGVPPHLRQWRQQSSIDDNIYDPLMVSIGPYHHGKSNLSQAEEFKHVCLDWCALGDDTRKAFFYNELLGRVGEMRSCYADSSVVGRFDDQELALMMLLDACFIVNYMHNSVEAKRTNFWDWWNCLGTAASTRFTSRDVMVLDNQIPFWVVTMLIDLLYDEAKEEGVELMDRFLGRIMVVNQNQAKCYREFDEPPIHILQACWRVIVGNNRANKPSGMQTRCGRPKESSSNHRMREIQHTFYSVTDLKAKGIRVFPSSSYSLDGFSFKSGAFQAQLHLPVRFISDLTQVFLSNMIAFEISPSVGASEPVVLSYAIFMKSLIESPEDVKELQKRRILFNTFASHEQVVKVFKEIDTFGLMNLDVFMDVKRSIEEHCGNKTRTWVADLIYTWFRSPWTAIALFAAILLLCLGFLQTLFTIHPLR